MRARHLIRVYEATTQSSHSEAQKYLLTSHSEP